MTNLTLRQREVLEYIEDFVAECDYPPTLRDIAAWFRISVSGVEGHLRALEAKGRIGHKPGAVRTLYVVRGHNDKGIPK